MDDESTQDERSVIADEPTLDANRTVGDESLAGTTEFPDKENVSSPVQTFSSAVDAQLAPGSTSSPTRQRNVSRIVLYSVFLWRCIVLVVVGLLLFQLSIGCTSAPVPFALTLGAYRLV